MSSDNGFAPAAQMLAAVAMLLTIACASAPHNPVLDAYPAGVIGRTTVDYYDVHGSTFADVRADMRRLGPKLSDSSFVGETRSPMRWTWKTESNGAASCTIRDVTVTVNAQVLLPRWTPPADTETGLVTEWNRFIAALETHESGHKDISAKAGRAIVDQLRGLSGLCSAVGTRANDLARAILDRAADAQRLYDAETRHGVTQGTGFGAGRFRPANLIGSIGPMALLAAPRLGTVRGPLTSSIERAWAALPTAYAASALQINARDAAAHAAGDSLTVRGMLGTTPVSAFVDCGSPPAGRHADSVDVSLFVTSRLDAAPSGSMLTNTVQAVARVLLYDIETAPIRGVAWRKYDTSLVWIERDWHLLSFAWKWLGEKKIRSASLPDFPAYAKDPTNDKALACQLWQLFDEADVVIAHNGDKFDQRKARAKFFEHGFEPHSPFRQVDTLKVAKRHFAFTSNRLDDLCRLRGIGSKMPTGGSDLWRGCLAGDEKSWRLMNRYNRHDVDLLEQLYLDLRPWADGHPNLALLTDKPKACPRCTSTRPLKSTGWRNNGATRRRRFRCLDCRAFVYGRTFEKAPVEYVNIQS